MKQGEVIRRRILAGLCVAFLCAPLFGQATLDIEQVIENAYQADHSFRTETADFTMMVESYARRLKGDGEVKEEKKFSKKYYYKDSLFKQEILEYYLDGEKQDDKKLKEQIKEAKERKKKGRSRDGSINSMKPFYPDQRENYLFSMPGVEKKNGFECYHIIADCRLDDDQLLEGDYWFETKNQNLVYAEFRPAKMPSRIKNLDMEMEYGLTADSVWLPKRFHLKGNGKVMIFIKFNFEVEEFFSDHQLNTGLSDDLFQESADED